MSANLDFVRSILSSWERGDFSSADWAHPEIEYVHADGPTPGSWTGLAAMAEAFRGVLSPWAELRIEPDAYRELDGERLLVLNRFSGRGKASGLEVGQVSVQAASLFHVRGDKVTRLVQYWNHKRALADVGLAPGPGSPPA